MIKNWSVSSKRLIGLKSRQNKKVRQIDGTKDVKGPNQIITCT